MPDDDAFIQELQKHGQLTKEQEQSANAPVEGDIEEEHKNFLSLLFGMIDKGDINLEDTQSFLNQDVYSELDEEWQDKTDLTLANIANQLRLIENYRKDENTPDESPQLQTMVEQLWQMKQRIEEHHDVFVF